MYFPDITEWPCPRGGVALAVTREPWEGNFVPVYWFAGYHYEGAGQIPLDRFPPTDRAGWINIGSQGGPSMESVCLGALGVGTEGRACCPPGWVPEAEGEQETTDEE